jgi:hypothetical protein
MFFIPTPGSVVELVIVLAALAVGLVATFVFVVALSIHVIGLIATALVLAVFAIVNPLLWKVARRQVRLILPYVEDGEQHGWSWQSARWEHVRSFLFVYVQDPILCFGR